MKGRSLAGILASLAALLLLAAACRLLDAERLRVTAGFDDVGDLATGAPVMMSDVQIGRVESIELQGTEAIVEMGIEPTVAVPRGVTARIRRTSLLGERIVELAPPAALPPGAPALEDGDRIEQTVTRADLEDLVVEGTDVLAPIAASEVATLVDEGAEGFGGRGEDLRELLGNLEVIVRGFARRTDDVRAVIGSLDRFNRTLSRRAPAHARAVANAAQSFEMLREESEHLEAAVRALARLGIHARAILDAHVDEMDRFFEQMQTILRALADEQDALIGILDWAPFHNRNTQLTEYLDFVQVYQDFIICGLNDEPADPARRCKEVEE